MRVGRAVAARRLARAVAATLLLVPLASCGHKGRPEPPLPRLPETPRDVTIRQRGASIEIEATYRLVGLGGRELRPPARPVLLFLPGGGGAASWGRPSRAREFSRSAQSLRLDSFSVEELGTTVTRRSSVPASLLEGGGGFVVAVALEDRSRRSMPSSRLSFSPTLPALSPLERFVARPLEEGIELTWEPPAEGAERIRIFRRVGEEPRSSAPWSDLDASEPSVIDDEVTYGDRVAYSAVVGQRGDGAPVESVAVEVVVEKYEDTFPPRAPQDLSGAVERGRIRLFWFPGGSTDVVEIVVERETSGEEGFLEVGRVAPRDAAFQDDAVEPGGSYRYRLRGVDARGNLSSWAGPTEWLTPRDRSRGGGES